MGYLQERFRHLDARFLTYLEEVLARVPAEVRENILGHADFQLIADDAFLNTCVVRQAFIPPVQTLAYINTKILQEPGHRIVLALASQIAFYTCSREKPQVEGKEAEDLLRKWGFEEELNAVRHEEALAKSEGYKVGYRWAKNQNKQYLLQHFGLYFDEWNARGLGKFPAGALKQMDLKHEEGSIFEEITHLSTPEMPAATGRMDATGPLSREAVLAGIMRALKEIQLHEEYGRRECEIASG